MAKTASDRSSRRTHYAVAFAAIVLAGGGAVAWLHGDKPASGAPAATPAAALELPAATAEAASTTAVGLAVPASSAVAASGMAASGKPAAAARPPEESPAETLRQVQLALSGGSPEDALKAAQTLRHCATMSRAPEALFAVRDQPDLMPANVKKAIKEMGGDDGVSNETIAQAQRDQRRCQVFDAATLARSGELLQKAYEGKAPGAALAYLQSLQSPEAKDKADPALIARLQADVRQAAQAGDPNTLMSLAMASGDMARDLGITPAQRSGYRNAYVQIQDELVPGLGKGMVKVIDAVALMNPTAPLTAAQQREADALTTQVVEAWRRGRKS